MPLEETGDQSEWVLNDSYTRDVLGKVPDDEKQEALEAEAVGKEQEVRLSSQLRVTIAKNLEGRGREFLLNARFGARDWKEIFQPTVTEAQTRVINDIGQDLINPLTALTSSCGILLLPGQAKKTEAAYRDSTKDQAKDQAEKVSEGSKRLGKAAEFLKSLEKTLDSLTETFNEPELSEIQKEFLEQVKDFKEKLMLVNEFLQLFKEVLEFRRKPGSVADKEEERKTLESRNNYLVSLTKKPERYSEGENSWVGRWNK